MARPRRRVARRVDRPHRQRAGARRQRHAAGAERVRDRPSRRPRSCRPALTWIVSPDPSVPVNVPLTVCDATFVM